MAMKGDALAWYQWQDARCPFYNWNELKTHLLKHFRMSSDEALHESFYVKRQEDTMADYRRQFKVLAKPGKEISNSVLERVVITKLEVNKAQVVGSSSKLLPTQTTDGSDQMDVQGDLTMKNVDGKVDQGIENEVGFQSSASNGKQDVNDIKIFQGCYCRVEVCCTSKRS